MRNLSVMSIKWGDVNNPVCKPHSLKMASENVQVEPWNTTRLAGYKHWNSYHIKNILYQVLYFKSSFSGRQIIYII